MGNPVKNVISIFTFVIICYIMLLYDNTDKQSDSLCLFLITNFSSIKSFIGLIKDFQFFSFSSGIFIPFFSYAIQ